MAQTTPNTPKKIREIRPIHRTIQEREREEEEERTEKLKRRNKQIVKRKQEIKAKVHRSVQHPLPKLTTTRYKRINVTRKDPSEADSQV